MATKARRPKFKINDRVTLASYTPLVPAYGGKPFLGRDTVLRVSNIAGKGTQRDPYFVHVTNDEGHFWQFPPDDLVPAEEGVSHARRKSPRQLDREIDQVLARPQHAIATRARHAETYPHYYVFNYPPGRGKGSGWRYPKQYFGPFDTKAEANAIVSHEMREYGQPRASYKIKKLMPAEFKKIWGAAPGKAAEGY